MTPVAVIILNWNGEKLLREFLPSVVANTPADIATVIVADNGSTDGSVELLRREFPTVQVLPFDSNYGFAGGYNRAIEATRYRYTVLLNSDVMTPPGWLEPLYRWAVDHPDTGALMPKIRAYRDKGMFEYAGAAGGFIDRNGYPYCRGRIFDTVEPDNGQYDTPMKVFWATGAAMFVDTEAYIAAGGLDEQFFAHMEEIDLCWRLLLAGKVNYVVPEACVYHLGGASLDASNPRKTYLNFRNNLLMLHKNLPPSVRKSRLFKRRLLDTIAWARFVVGFKWKHAAAVWRAHRDYARMSRAYNTTAPLSVRANALCFNGVNTSGSNAAAVGEIPNLLDGTPNILTAYYLHRRHRYSDL